MKKFVISLPIVVEEVLVESDLEQETTATTTHCLPFNLGVVSWSPFETQEFNIDDCSFSLPTLDCNSMLFQNIFHCNFISMLTTFALYFL